MRGLRVITWAEIQAKAKAEAKLQATLKPSDPRHASMFRLARKHLDLYWGGYEYSIELSRIDTPIKLLGWQAHLLEKGWEHTTPARVRRLVLALDRRFGWNIWGAAP